jgi:peroxiredoxin
MRPAGTLPADALLHQPMSPSSHSETIASIPLFGPDGGATTLGAFAADPLVVILVRYFGCLPCQEYVRDLDRDLDRFPEGTRVISVGGSADYQARWLRDTKGVGMPLLLDPEQRVRAVAGVGDLTARQMSRLGGANNYIKSLVHGFRPQVPTADMTKAPGIVVFDADFTVEWVHRGEMLGDYPPIETVIGRMTAPT